MLRRQKRHRQLLVTVSCARGATLNAQARRDAVAHASDLGGASAGIADEAQTQFGLTLAEAHADAARPHSGLKR